MGLFQTALLPSPEYKTGCLPQLTLVLMRDEPQRGDFVQVHYTSSSSQTVLRAHHSAWALGETGPILNHLQRHIKSKGPLMLKTFVCGLRYVSAGEDETAPGAMLLHAFINHILFLQINSPGVGAKNRFPHLIPAKAREEKGVSFQFKCSKVNIQPPHPSLQISFTLQSQCSIVANVNSIQNTDILHPFWGIVQWFLMFTGK